MIEPLRVKVEVDCSADHAFEIWTGRIAQWWPRGHTASGDPDVDVVLEGRVGGRIFERAPNGAETDWGEVTVWEPPGRLGYLWHLRRDRADATEVEITFTPLDSARARVEIEHRGWERLGADGPGWRERNTAGWGGLLPHYVEACANGIPGISP